MIIPIKIVLADDHEIFRDGFRVMLKKQPHIELIGEAGNGDELIGITKQLKPDVVITDIKMPKMDGITATKFLSQAFPHIGIIALSMFDEENLIVDMMEAGASGYLLKNAHKNEIIAAIETVYNGSTYYCMHTSSKLAHLIGKSKFNPKDKIPRAHFSDTELKIIQMICKEFTNKEIAQRLDLSTRTIEGYRERIQDKMNVKNAAGIVIYAIRNSLFHV